MRRLACFACWSVLLTLVPTLRAEVRKGYHQKVNVTAPTRMDWVFVLANQSPAETPAGWLDDYDSTATTYELFVPPKYNPKQPTPLVVFVSPGDNAGGFRAWREVCEKQGILFAGPHGAGNNCPTRKRVRMVLDVFDEVRRTYNVDPDRTYLAGFSGGGRVAAMIAFALPEYVGGVIPVCATGELRQEPWLRHRLFDRLSVALISGENDFNRGEVERFRGPFYIDLGIRTKVWVYPKMGHSLPNGQALAEVHQWLDAGAAQRAKLARQYSASRVEPAAAPNREEAAKLLFAEATARLKQDKSPYRGLMQLMGIRVRWNDLPQAEAALKILSEYEAKAEKPWEADDIAEQWTYLVAQARSIDAYASGPLAKPYEAQRKDMAKAAINLYQQIIKVGRDPKETEHAQQRVPELEKLTGG